MMPCLKSQMMRILAVFNAVLTVDQLGIITKTGDRCADKMSVASLSKIVCLEEYGLIECLTGYSTGQLSVKLQPLSGGCSTCFVDTGLRLDFICTSFEIYLISIGPSRVLYFVLSTYF